MDKKTKTSGFDDRRAQENESNGGDELDARDCIVIGAGISGSVVAGGLAAAGKDVLIIEKARGTGGRLSSKRVALGELDLTYDLGAQGFEVTHADFSAFLSKTSVTVETMGASDIGDTSPEPASQHVYIEGRNSTLARHSLSNADTMFGWRVEHAHFDKQTRLWNVSLSKGQSRSIVRSYTLVIAVPPKQAAQLLGSKHRCYDKLNTVGHTLQWVVMYALRKDTQVHKQLVSFANAGTDLSASIELLSVDSMKQGRVAQDGFDIVLLHANEAWSNKHINDDKHDVALLLQADLAELLGLSPIQLERLIHSSHGHRWLYAKPISDARLNSECMSVPKQNLWLCGDYYSVPSQHGVESAYLSAKAVLNELLFENEAHVGEEDNKNFESEQPTQSF